MRSSEVCCLICRTRAIRTLNELSSCKRSTLKISTRLIYDLSQVNIKNSVANQLRNLVCTIAAPTLKLRRWKDRAKSSKGFSNAKSVAVTKLVSFRCKLIERTNQWPTLYSAMTARQDFKNDHTKEFKEKLAKINQKRFIIFEFLNVFKCSKIGT